MSAESRKRALFLLFSSLVLTGIIATGLTNVTFRPGLPIPAFESGQVVIPPEERAAPVGMGMGRLAAILVLIALGVAVLLLIIRAARGIHWRRLLAGLWSLSWKLALGAGLILLVFALLPHTAGSGEAEPLPPARPLATAPLGPVPPGLIWAAGIVLGAAVLLVSLRLLLARARAPEAPWVQELVLARRALGEGGNPREVIVRCYTRMAEALQEERGIERQQSMTTGEFETVLASKGLPKEPVTQLTRLFEAARYGRGTPVAEEGLAAMTCLDAILDYCRRSAPVEAAL